MDVSPELVERAIALVRKMGGNSSLCEPYCELASIRYSSAHYDEARAIVAELSAPVDPDEERALQLATDIKCGGPSVDLALAGIRLGRQLAAEGR